MKDSRGHGQTEKGDKELKRDREERRKRPSATTVNDDVSVSRPPFRS